MINLIIWLLIGALIGWLASMVMRTDARQGALLNIVVGIVGAMIGGFFAGWPDHQQQCLKCYGTRRIVHRRSRAAGDRQSGDPRARPLTVR